MNHRVAAGHQHGQTLATDIRTSPEPLEWQCPHAQAQQGLGRVWLCPQAGKRGQAWAQVSHISTPCHEPCPGLCGSSRMSSGTESGQPWQREPQHCSHAWTGWFSRGWEIHWLYGNPGEGALLSQLNQG